MSRDRRRVNVTYDEDTYQVLVNIAATQNITIPELIRSYTERGINGTVTQQNIDFLTPIIRSQLKSIMDVQFERLASMIAKTCIQSGTAAYLSAEALNSFVPVQNQRDFVDAYDAARKKSIQYMKSSLNVGGVNMDEEE